jgi:MFS transporter, DHA2 family, multidrug resistance protein
MSAVRSYATPGVAPALAPVQPPAKLAAVAPADAVSFRAWLAVIGSALGAFLAVLNIQIVNAGLADIQGAIGAGIDDGGWISTSYLVTEIIVIPLSAWLAQIFSLRRYLLVTTALFLLFTALCAFAQNLGQMIVLRAVQGFAGGALIPLAFSLIMTSLPRAKQPIGLAMFSVSAVFAPAIGPTIGGYFDENFGWQYIFFINLLPGLIMLAMLFASLPSTPMRLDLLRRGDWPGIATMAIGLGALQTVLEEGNKDDWFGSPFIVRLSVVATIALGLFLWIELTTAHPVINLRLLLQRNFGLGSLSNFLLGAGLYGSSFILPLYLSQMQGYNAQQIGEVLAWSGLPQLAIIPFAPMLMRRFDARLLVAVGLGLFAASNFFNLTIDQDYAGPQLLWPNIIRAIGQAIVLTPLSVLTTAGIEVENAGSAAALFNMMRNLGGAIGIAALQTFLTKREQYHSNILSAQVSLFDPATRQRIAGLQQRFLARGLTDQAQAWHESVVAIGRTIRAQASLLGYSDAFFLIGIILVVSVVASLCLRKMTGPGTGGAH